MLASDVPRPMSNVPEPARRAPGCGRRSRPGRAGSPQYSTGMTGQSSGRGKCVTPNVYQSTTSVSTSDRSAAVHRGSPSPPACWFGIVAGGPPLVRRVRRDPQVVAWRSRRAARRDDSGCGEQRRRRHRRARACSATGCAERVAARRGSTICHAAARAAFDGRAAPPCSRVEPGRSRTERVAPRVVVARAAPARRRPRTPRSRGRRRRSRGARRTGAGGAAPRAPARSTLRERRARRPARSPSAT